jgi:hypothetical protein
MRVEKLAISVFEQGEQEYANAMTAKAKAVQDFNIMLGNLEDPSEDDEGEEDYE